MPQSTVTDVDINALNTGSNDESGAPAGPVESAGAALDQAPVNVTNVDVTVIDVTDVDVMKVDIAVLGDGANAATVKEPAADRSEALVAAPVNVCGIGVGVLADAGADCGSAGGTSSGRLVAVPVTVCGVGVGVLGDASADCSPAGAARAIRWWPSR